MISEGELAYLIDLLKSTKHYESAQLSELHRRATKTAKILTIELVEGKIPIHQVCEQYSNVCQQAVRTLLTRVAKLYNARSEVKRIIQLILKIYHSGDSVEKNKNLLL